jgi:hypothetical protein
VTLVRAQWWEYGAGLADGRSDRPDRRKYQDARQGGIHALEAKIQDGRRSDAEGVKSTRKVYRQAYLGANVLLEIGDAPCKDHFSFKCMTGKRDRNKNTFFGIVRAMKDPARWSNKWMSQTMHIMNTTAKGGIAANAAGSSTMTRKAKPPGRSRIR